MLIKAFYLCISLIPFQLQAQMEMSVDPKTSEIKYDVIGNVVLLKGRVYRQSGPKAKEEELGIKFGIKAQDIITTTKNSFIQIKLVDGTTITLAEKTRFNFQEFKYTTKVNRNVEFNLMMGKIRINIPIKIEEGEINLKTKTASFGIRGTRFLANQMLDTQGNSIEQIAILNGQVEVLSRGEKKSRILKTRDHYLLEAKKTGEEKDLITKISEEKQEYLLASNVQNGEKPFLEDISSEKLIQKFEEEGSEENSNNIIFKHKKRRRWKNSLRRLNRKLKKLY